MPLTRARVVSLGGMLVATSILAGAQAPKPAAEQPQLLLASITTVKPGMIAEYTDLQIKEIMPAQRKGGSPGRQAWSSGVFGTPGEFAFFTPIASMAQFDSQSPMAKALGPEGAAALNAKVARLTDARRSMLVRTRPDLSYIPNPGAPPAPLALVSVIDIIPGRRAEFEAAIRKEVLPPMQQAKVPSYSVTEIMYGDPAGGYITAIGFDSYEAIGKGHPFTVVLGEQGARQLEAKFAGIIGRLERFVVRYRADLSWSAKAGSN